MKHADTTSKKGRGFTLVETLVAITILTVVLGVGMGVLQQSLQTANLVRDESTAYFLAEEAIEYARSVRDTDTLTKANWLAGLSECEGSGVTCGVDATNGSNTGVSLCSGSSCILSYTGSTTTDGLYGGNGTATKFSRTINLKVITTDEVLVTAVVTWNAGTFTVKDELYNWQS
jgi:prepilin-type N-terminal cleavage/methylation domain-containing protein